MNKKKLLKEKIFQFMKNSEPVKMQSISLIINNFKEEGFPEQEITEAVEKLMKEGEIYEIPKSICLIEKISLKKLPIKNKEKEKIFTALERIEKKLKKLEKKNENKRKIK